MIAVAKLDEDSDLIFGYLEEQTDSSLTSCESSTDVASSDLHEDEDDEGTREKRKAFWDSQTQLLKATLYRTTSIETKVRQATKTALISEAGTVLCSCQSKITATNSSCQNCTVKQVSDSIRAAGFNCVVCKSNWKSSSGIQSGEHTYLEVVEESGSKKGTVKVIVELNFRAEFEMSRATQEYIDLIEKLPELFVGKVERLQSLIKILCCASKKCMEERKMHIAPWRKQKYMQAKWQGTPLPQGAMRQVTIERLARPKSTKRASMLSFDFLEHLPGLHLNAVKVI